MFRARYSVLIRKYSYKRAYLLFFLRESTMVKFLCLLLPFSPLAVGLPNPCENTRRQLHSDGTSHFHIENVLDPESDCKAKRQLSRVFEPEELTESCGDQIYDVSLGIGTGHFCIFAKSPTEDCPSVRFHLLNPSEKQIEERSVSDFAPGNLFLLGSFRMSELAEAHEGVRTKSETYDVVTTNCADILFQLMCSLGIEVTDEQLSWAADRIIADREGSSIILAHLAGSEYRNLVTDDSLSANSTVSDEAWKQMAQSLVQYSAQSRLECPTDPATTTSGGSTVPLLASAAIGVLAALL